MLRQCPQCRAVSPLANAEGKCVGCGWLIKPDVKNGREIIFTDPRTNVRKWGTVAICDCGAVATINTVNLIDGTPARILVMPHGWEPDAEDLWANDDGSHGCTKCGKVDPPEAP